MNACKPCIVLASFLFLSVRLLAQSHDEPGYYIDIKGDTVNGIFPDYAEYRNSPGSVPFLRSGAANPLTLTPDNSRKFSVAHTDTYIAYKGKRLNNATDYHNATGGNADIYEDVSVFIRELYNDGRYQLFELRSAKRSNFYISSYASPLTELYFKEYLVDNNDNGGGTDNVVESPIFKQQLIVFFQHLLQTKANLKSRIRSTKYTSESLKDLFYAMTQDHEPRVKQKYPAQVFVGFGASSNKLTVSADNVIMDPGINEKVTAGTYASRTTPVFEAGVKLFSQRNYGRLFFTLRANYYTFSNSAEYRDAFANTTYRTTFKSSVMSFPFGIGYKLVNDPNFSFEVTAGVSLLLLPQNTQTQTSNPGPAETSVTQSDGKSNSFSFFGEAAVVAFKRVSVFGAYYSPCSIADFVEYNPVHVSFKFGFRYYLF